MIAALIFYIKLKNLNILNQIYKFLNILFYPLDFVTIFLHDGHYILSLKFYLRYSKVFSSSFPLVFKYSANYSQVESLCSGLSHNKQIFKPQI